MSLLEEGKANASAIRKERAAIATFVFFLAMILLSGCANVMSPAVGVFYSATNAPIAATEAASYSKVGTASCSSILGIVATGDASITAAMKNGGITKIHHVDYHSTNVLGFYAEMTTSVYGD